jgi:hypothetical protein
MFTNCKINYVMDLYSGQCSNVTDSLILQRLSDNPNYIYYDCDYSKGDVTFLLVEIKKY